MLDDHRDDYLYFSPELVPYSTHPIVLREGRHKEALFQHLLGYLHFTAVLEHKYVNEATFSISQKKLPWEMPAGMVMDAFRIYCDEAYHALASADVISQLEHKTKIPGVHLSEPACFLEIEHLIKQSRARDRVLISQFFVIVSETLISSVLMDVHRDRRVIGVAREVIRDHAEDEAKHHIYFARYAEYLWARLTPEERQFVGPLIPGFIKGFLSPDIKRISEVLQNLGLAGRDIQKVISDCYDGDDRPALKAASKATCALFKRIGALDDAKTEDSFRSCIIGG